SARAAFAPTPSADGPSSGGEARGPVGEQARAGPHQFLAVGDNLASVLRKQLHVPGHAFLVGSGRLGDRSRRRQLTNQLGRQGHARLRARQPRPVDLFQGVEELLLHLGLFLPDFAECAGREGRAWPVHRLAEIICHVNLPYLSGRTTYSDATASVVRTLHANPLQDGPQRTGRHSIAEGAGVRYGGTFRPLATGCKPIAKALMAPPHPPPPGSQKARPRRTKRKAARARTNTHRPPPAQP